MSKSDLNKVHVIPMPIQKDYHILSFNKEDKLNSRPMIIMTYINEEEEKELDTGRDVILHRGNKNFLIENRKVYCYGEVNFTTGSDDMIEIDKFDFLNYLSGFSGLPVYSNYNYEKHECISDIPYARWTETWHPAIISQFAHGCLGKPERIVLFKILV